MIFFWGGAFYCLPNEFFLQYLMYTHVTFLMNKVDKTWPIFSHRSNDVSTTSVKSACKRIKIYSVKFYYSIHTVNSDRVLQRLIPPFSAYRRIIP